MGANSIHHWQLFIKVLTPNPEGEIVGVILRDGRLNNVFFRKADLKQDKETEPQWSGEDVLFRGVIFSKSLLNRLGSYNIPIQLFIDRADRLVELQKYLSQNFILLVDRSGEYCTTCDDLVALKNFYRGAPFSVLKALISKIKRFIIL